MLRSVTVMFVDFSGTFMQVTVSVAIMQLDVSATHASNSFCSKFANDSFFVIDKFTIIIVFIVIMQMKVSVARWGHLGFLEREES